MDLSPLRKFEVVGPDAEALLQAAVTRNIRKLADGIYFNLPFTRPAVEKQAAHKLKLLPQ